MFKFRILPQICMFKTFKDFVNNFPICEDDLLVTQSFIYEPFIKELNLPCKVLLQDKFGSGEPSDVMVDKILEEVRSINYTRVIGVGGGTVIDISKLLSLKAFNCFEELVDNPEKIIREKELILIPTTCGTGSEVTRSCIVSSVKRQTKIRMAYDQYFANTAVLIPELISSLPYKFFAYSSIDALVHAVESYLSPNANCYTELFAIKAIELIVNAYTKIVNNGNAIIAQVQEDVLLASNYAGISFGNAGCGAVHALAFPLSGRYHVAHGESNYQFFIEVLNTYYATNPNGKIDILCEQLSCLLGCEKNFAIQTLAELLNKILPVKKLHDFGMKKSEIEEFANEVYDELQAVLATSYIPLNAQELAEINKKCY